MPAVTERAASYERAVTLATAAGREYHRENPTDTLGPSWAQLPAWLLLAGFDQLETARLYAAMREGWWARRYDVAKREGSDRAAASYERGLDRGREIARDSWGRV